MSCNVFNRALYSLEIDTKAIQALKKLPEDSYYFQVNGTPVYKIEELKPNQPFQIHFRLCGGKGGFGSLLKSFRIHRSTNQLMCRNLSGRRLCDVKEEERLRKWISKTAEREKEKQRKKKEKYEKLKNGNRTKHEFSDPEYLRKRDMVLDETEDAVEAGISVLKEAPSDEPGPSSSKPIEDIMEDSSSDSDSDFDLNGEVPLKKRKVAPVAYDLPEKKPKIAENLEIEPPTNQETPVEKKTLSSASAGKKFQLIVKNVKKDEEPAKKKQVEKEKAPSPPKDFPPVDLDSYNSVSELEALGLDHLKHALEARCLKCGGSLQERASRLFSVKGLAPEEYPKNIKAPVKKK